MHMDVEYGAPGSEPLISGTTSEEINSIMKNQGGDSSFGFQENISIGKYKGTDEIVDLSISEYAQGYTSQSSDQDCEDRSPQEEAAYQAAYKTALAAANGGASASEAKQAAMSAVYGTGQGNQRAYEYNEDCPECQSVLDGSELETTDTGIQLRQKKGGKISLPTFKTKDESYSDQADDILSETLDKDLSTYRKKEALKVKQQKEEENESDDVFDQAIDAIPRGGKK